MSAISWSPQQETALAAVGKWLKRRKREQQVFRLFGYAGTGLTRAAERLTIVRAA